MATTKVQSELIASTVPLGRRNLVRNGAMRVDQRNGGSAFDVSDAVSNAWCLDGWFIYCNAGGGTIQVQQVTDSPTGFNFSQKCTATVIDDDGADSFVNLQNRIEGYDTDFLLFGTAAAKTVTLSFHVKSSLSGTFGGSLVGANYATGYTFQYTIDSADTWEKKTITITGDTDTSETYYRTTGAGLVIYWDLGGGSTYERAAANSWSAGGLVYSPRISGNVKVSRTLNATWQIAGAQLEVGSTATEFEHRTYNDELHHAQRYFQSYGGESANALSYKGSGHATYYHLSTEILPVPMRAAATVAKSGTFATTNTGEPTFWMETTYAYAWQSLAAAEGAWVWYSNTSGKITLTSEL